MHDNNQHDRIESFCRLFVLELKNKLTDKFNLHFIREDYYGWSLLSFRIMIRMYFKTHFKFQELFRKYIESDITWIYKLMFRLRQVKYFQNSVLQPSLIFGKLKKQQLFLFKYCLEFNRRFNANDRNRFEANRKHAEKYVCLRKQLTILIRLFGEVL